MRVVIFCDSDNILTDCENVMIIYYDVSVILG